MLDANKHTADRVGSAGLQNTTSVFLSDNYKISALRSSTDLPYNYFFDSFCDIYF